MEGGGLVIAGRRRLRYEDPGMPLQNLPPPTALKWTARFSRPNKKFYIYVYGLNVR